MDLKNEATAKYTKYSTTIDIIFDTQLGDAYDMRYELKDVLTAYKHLQEKIEKDKELTQEYKDELKKRIEEKTEKAKNREEEIKKAEEKYSQQQYITLINAKENYRRNMRLRMDPSSSKLRTMIEHKGYYIFFNEEQIEAIYEGRINQVDFEEMGKEYPVIFKELEEAINKAKNVGQREEQE